MDLFVFLIRRRELDVAYISVSAITRDFLDWIERVDFIDLDAAGDFILLVATLLQFKVMNLLPGAEPETSDAEISSLNRERSEEELLALRSTAARLGEMEARQVNLFKRGNVHLAGIDEEITNEMLSDVSVYDLALAFRDLIYKLPDEPTHVIEEIPYTLEGQMAFILSFIGKSRRIRFEDLAEALLTRLSVIMTFLAMLELMRVRNIRVVQKDPYGPLWLIKPQHDQVN